MALVEVGVDAASRVERDLEQRELGSVGLDGSRRRASARSARPLRPPARRGAATRRRRRRRRRAPILHDAAHARGRRAQHPAARAPLARDLVRELHVQPAAFQCPANRPCALRLRHGIPYIQTPERYRAVTSSTSSSTVNASYSETLRRQRPRIDAAVTGGSNWAKARVAPAHVLRRSRTRHVEVERARVPRASRCRSRARRPARRRRGARVRAGASRPGGGTSNSPSTTRNAPQCPRWTCRSAPPSPGP